MISIRYQQSRVHEYIITIGDQIGAQHRRPIGNRVRHIMLTSYNRTAHGVDLLIHFFLRQTIL